VLGQRRADPYAIPAIAPIAAECFLRSQISGVRPRETGMWRDSYLVRVLH